MNLLLFFYGSLYVVIEGYQELRVSDQKIDNLLQNTDNVDMLRRFRNAVFHYQKDLISPKLQEFLDTPDTENWTRQLFFAFNSYFSRKIKNDWSKDIEKIFQ